MENTWFIRLERVKRRKSNTYMCSFLKIPLGYANLYGIVTQTGAAAMPDTLKEIYEITPDIVKNNQWLNLVLVGEQQGVKFFRGVSQSPYF